MNVQTLQEKAKEINDKTRQHFKLYSQEEKEILTKTIKLSEEVGELCNDILSVLKVQRKSKLDKFDKAHIYEEFADVILTTLQLASIVKVDVNRALQTKMKKIEVLYAKDH